MPDPADPIPENFARTIVEVHGERGAAWLQELPALLSEYGRRWSLTIAAPFAPLSYNYVAPAIRADGTEAVLKLGVPERELVGEMAALRVFDSAGSVRLLEADQAGGAMLLERLRPGTMLLPLSLAAFAEGKADEAATTIAADVMRRLWRPAPPDPTFVSVTRWADGLARLRHHFNGGTGPLPTPLVEEAETRFAELLGSMAAPVLLHGDLHHENILAAERAPWLAIDPKGVVGEPAYEVGAFLRNPMPHLLTTAHPKQILARRLDLLAEALELDRKRVRGWALAQAVLSAWWSIEDHGSGWESAIACAEYLSDC